MPVSRTGERRSAQRVSQGLPARLTWKDRSGTTRFALVTTRDMSELGVFVESETPLSLPLYRLVYLQIDGDHRSVEGLPAGLDRGRALAAVYRVQPGERQGEAGGFALRLMVEPRRWPPRRPPQYAAL
jgi:hypothetical protein